MDEVELIPNLVEDASEEVAYDAVAVVPALDPELNGTEQMAQTDATKRVPVTIITGYLGSGKSTMLGSVSKRGGRRMAVILNEFGDTSAIERSLTVQDPSQDQIEEWVDLGNGCLCCTVKDDGVAAIERLVKKRSGFDHIILETSGLADPGPIAKMFWLDDSIASNVYIDGVVTVLDGEHATKVLEEDVARTQVALADVVVVNKTDKLECSAQVRRRIAEINPLAPIYETEYGNIEVDKILDLHAYEGRDVAGIVADIGHVHQHEESKDTDTAKTEMRSVCIDFPKFTTAAQLAQFETRLQTLLWDSEEFEIHRTKGLLFVGDSYRVVQGVRATYDIIQGKQDVGEIPLAQNRVVFIGRGLRRETLMSILLANQS